MSFLDSVLNFTDLLQKFRAVERMVFVNNQERNENDIEHSFSLAMLAWYINEAKKFKLDTEKILKYSLIHDIVEVHAGDTFFYHKDERSVIDKKMREERAAHRLQVEYPEFPMLHAAIESYEKKEDKESKFVYALDKIEPILNIYLDSGRSWKRDKVTMEMIKSKSPQISVDPEIMKIFEELLGRLNDKKNELFNS